MKSIRSTGASPLSQAVVANGFVFTSGQVGKDAEGKLPDTFAEQLDQALRNLEQLLAAVGSSLPQVVKVNAYITSEGWDGAFNEIYRQHLAEPFPARTRVEVVRLAPGYLVELDAVAVIGPRTVQGS